MYYTLAVLDFRETNEYVNQSYPSETWNATFQNGGEKTLQGSEDEGTWFKVFFEEHMAWEGMIPRCHKMSPLLSACMFLGNAIKRLPRPGCRKRNRSYFECRAYRKMRQFEG